MYELIRYLGGEESSVSITKLDDSIYGHMLAYSAEESRKQGKIVYMEEFMKRE